MVLGFLRSCRVAGGPLCRPGLCDLVWGAPVSILGAAPDSLHRQASFVIHALGSPYISQHVHGFWHGAITLGFWQLAGGHHLVGILP